MEIESRTVQEILNVYREKLTRLYSLEETESLANLIFKEVLGYDQKDILLNSDKEVVSGYIIKLNSVLRELEQGKPVQYVLGYTDFFDVRLNVNNDVLIPRQETEELVDWIIKDLQNLDHYITILDIGTGSGCISIALKKNLENVHLRAVDVSQEALNIAVSNAEQNDVEIEFVKLDILNEDEWEMLPKVNVIVSNPPYVRVSEKSNMHRNILDNEPHIALFVSDEDPLMFYEKITDFAQHNLEKGASLYFEINEALGEKVSALLANKGFQEIELRQDLNGKDRMIKAIAP